MQTYFQAKAIQSEMIARDARMQLARVVGTLEAMIEILNNENTEGTTWAANRLQKLRHDSQVVLTACSNLPMVRASDYA